MSIVQHFMNKHEDNLIKTYITERQRHNNELGILLTILNSATDDNTSYLPLSSNLLTDELRADILSKNNDRNSKAFFCIMDKQSNLNSLVVRNLEK
jgi:hypothetical protein